MTNQAMMEALKQLLESQATGKPVKVRRIPEAKAKKERKLRPIENVQYAMDGDILHLRIDTSVEGVPTSSEKSNNLRVASTLGQWIKAGGVEFNLNAIRKQ
jgi:hypothetical protein|tara:strand:- start:12566 stop:12868 length:303 start_codon:yes stop_codon:yes gene_type:complete